MKATVPASTARRVDRPATPVLSEARSDFAPAERFINRHVSWLDFNERVLALADDRSLPILERAKFMAIFSANLDEFFQVRVAELDEQAELGVGAMSPEGLSPGEQLRAVRARARELVAAQDRLFAEQVAPGLAEAGIRITDWENLDGAARKHLTGLYEDRIFPVLTPLSVDPAHPFPYISNLSLNLGVVVRDPLTRIQRFARVKIPPLLPRFLVLPDGERFVPVEQVIAAHLASLFPGMEIVAHHAFRVSRNADLDLQEDEVENLRTAIESVLILRRRSPHAVRLEVEPGMPEEMRDRLVRELELDPDDIYEVLPPLDLSGLWMLYDLPRPELKLEPWIPVTASRLAPREGEAPDLFRVIREGDVLLHHPYESFSTSVVAFIDQAARDPDVMAIKQTMYRTSAQESPIVRALARAAQAGKQVVAMVELKARGDEEANIAWGDALEKAGVHVVYGLVGLKTHAKISLVVRREAAGIARYVHIGTGNYNHTTARLYEDLGLLSDDPKLGADLTDLFNFLTGYSRKRRYRKLLVAPLTLRPGILDLIGDEARPGGRIVLKMNSLVDTEMIDALYAASRAGATIDLIVRGMCCLRPGVPGLSERVRVRSIVGRYLEHSRIFRFGEEEESRQYLIGSADLMPRNLDRRVEAVTPVEDPALQARLEEILRVNLEDDVLAWELGNDGRWVKVPTERGVSVHDRLQQLALARGHPPVVDA